MIPARDPNAPPDPNELRVIPSNQHPAIMDATNTANPVVPGDPPPGSPANPDSWTGQGDNPADRPGEPAVPPEHPLPPAPVLTSINPTNSNHASQNITATGTDFTPSAKLVFDGTEQATTYASATSLKASVNKPGAGTFDVWVRDVGGDSAKLQFDFTGAATTEKEPAKKK